MKLETDEAEVLSRIVRSIGANELVRVIIMTSTRANPNAPLDILSDYDIDLIVSDARPLLKNEDWMRGPGEPLLRVRDSERVWGMTRYNRMVLYSDGTKIDFSLWPLTLFDRIRKAGKLTDDLDLGYKVILDKDNLTPDLPAPTYAAHIPAKPTEQEFQALIEEFWFCATYVAKYLWRGEFMPAIVILDYEIKYLIVRKMLIWHIEIDHQWTVKPGFFGRGLQKHIDPETWAQFQQTYKGPEPKDTWAALSGTITLFTRVAVTVASDLGYPYPHEVDAQMLEYLRQIEALPEHDMLQY